MRKFFDKSMIEPYSVFVLWCIYCIVFIAAAEIARQYGAIHYIYSVDNTKLSILICLILVWKTIECGRRIFVLSSFESSERDIMLSKKASDSGWFWSDLVTSIGMIGTVVGFVIMLASFENLDFDNVESVQDMITSLSYGMSTALSTTLVGLLASVILKIQYFKLDDVIKNNEKKLSL